MPNAGRQIWEVNVPRDVELTPVENRNEQEQNKNVEKKEPRKIENQRKMNEKKERWIEGSRFFDFGRGWGPHKCFGCCPIVALSFFYLLCPRLFENFLISALDCFFWVFTLESFFHHFFLTVLLCTWQFKIHPEQVKDWSRFFCWLRKRDNSLLITKNFLKEEKLFSPSIHVQSKWTFIACNVGLGSGFRKKG